MIVERNTWLVIIGLIHYLIGAIFLKGFGVLLLYSVFRIAYTAGAKEVFYPAILVELILTLLVFKSSLMAKIYGLLKLIIGLLFAVMIFAQTGSVWTFLVWVAVVLTNILLFYIIWFKKYPKPKV